MNYDACALCPRQCGVNRSAGQRGFCGGGDRALVAKAMRHFWEEPVLAGSGGSGAVFFGGCTLGCRYCQNRAISGAPVGAPMDSAGLRAVMEDLIAQGAENIDLVTPTQFLPTLLPALTPKLPVPVVYNCGGYERVETLRLLEGKVQIWLPDLKYGLEEPARRYSHAPDYFPVATEAIREMFRQVGPCRMEDGLLRQGVVIRHLVLPGQLESTRRVIDWVARTFRPGEVLFSLMSQYTPQPGAEGPLRRHVTAAEYRAAAEYMENCGIVDGFVQERTSAREEYTPAFDLTGV